MSRRPRIVDELGRELVRAAREAEAREGRRARLLGRLPRAFVVGLLALLGLAAAAAAASLIIGRGDPIPPAAAIDVPLELRPVAGSARLNGLDVRDPDGGPVWDVRTSRSRTGAVCETVGQVLDGELGLLGLDRRFRALPAGAADTCSTPQRSGATLAGARAFRGGASLSDLTVVNGVAAPGVRRAIAVAGGRTVAMKLGPAGAFLAVFQGLPEQVRPRVVLTDAAGRRTTLRFADTGEFIAGDPTGGAPWAIDYRAGASGLRCVAAHRERGPDSPLPSPRGTFNPEVASVPPRCGTPAHGVVAIRRFVPRDQRSGHAFWWGLNPARTVVWGVAPAGVRNVVLTGNGAPRKVAADRPHGGFLAVLSGRVDPRRLHVSAGGHMLDPAAAVGTLGQALAPTKTPAWRSVASIVRHTAMPDPFRATPGTIAIARRANDPTGGSPWKLRVWKARIDARLAGPGNPELDLVCFAYGIEHGPRLVTPLAGGAERTVTSGGDDARCNGPRWLRTHAPGAEVRTYVENPDSPDPKPVRVIVAGLFGNGVRSAQLLGAGPARPLVLGRDGTFLVVLGPEFAGRPLRLRQVRDDGSVRTSGAGEGVGCEPTPGRSVRVADPDGGQPWTSGDGTLSGRDPVLAAGGACHYLGRLAGDRVGQVLPGETWLRYGAMAFSGGGSPRRGAYVWRRPALTMTVQGPQLQRPGESTPKPSAAQVARRTLPERTVVYGRARENVTSVTLRTPRDVRTVRPGPGGTYLAVYDGAFYGGQVQAIGHLRGGGVVTKTAPTSRPF
jgi:hypothetical protein